ncbi:MAG: hypothetical protein IJ916_11275 [Paludibacteraceae bacterium]|nr:hypothetical protein [Paludibacteraceae bacterium]
MKKIALLTFSVVASIASSLALNFDNAYWVIENGKLSNNVTVREFDSSIVPDPNYLEEGTAPDGTPAVAYKQISTSTSYPDVKLEFTTPLDLTKNYIMVIEYMIPASHAGAAIVGGNKPLFIMSLFDNPEKMDSWGVNSDSVASVFYIDAKFGATNEWVTTCKYTYANPTRTSIQGMVISYAREVLDGSLTEFAQIKSLGFVANEENVKPFYAENFSNLGLAFWTDEGSVTNTTAFFYKGGIKPTGSLIKAFRSYEDESTQDQDGSGYIDCELMHGLSVVSDRKNDIVFDSIPLPAGIQEIHSEMLIKYRSGYKKDTKTLEDVYNDNMPISITFKGAGLNETVDLANDTLRGIWTKYKGVVPVPAGAEYIALTFSSLTGVSYVVDEVILSATTFTNVEDFLAENNAFEVKAYIDANGNIVVLNGELQAVYNLNGSVATVNDKAIIILVKNEEGKVAAAKLIRK